MSNEQINRQLAKKYDANFTIEDIAENYAQRYFDPLETLQLLKASGAVFGSWGTELIIPVEDKALILKVNGMKFDSFVIITLAWDDTYKVDFIDKDSEEVIKSLEDVYFYQLSHKIDAEVETI